MQHTTYHFNLNTINLFGQIWQPKKSKALIVLVHGMGEHSSRYADSVIPQLLEHHFAVIAVDQFGHGLSEGKRGHCPNYESLLDLIAITIKKGESLFSGIPVFLYGHSMGGNLVINYVLKRKHNLKGVIATSPFLRLAFQPPKWKMIVGKLLLHVLPSIALSSELEVDAISRDATEVKRYTEDKLVHDKVSPMYSFPVMEAGEWAIKNAETLQTAMLVVHGTGDRIIDYKASKIFCEKAEKAEIYLFKDGYHELHHDLCKKEFMQVVLEWLDKRV